MGELIILHEWLMERKMGLDIGELLRGDWAFTVTERPTC
jgi:hypothetical protein